MRRYKTVRSVASVVRGLCEDNLKTALATRPLATSIGGHFREQLTTAAAKAGWTLQIELSCTSFTQAARVVEAGAMAAALPSLAAGSFPPGTVVEFSLPFLKSYAQTIGIAWNPRLAEVRPLVERAVGILPKVLADAVLN